MTILVTGGAGYIGSHTCVELLEKGYDVVVADNFYNSKAEVLHRVEEITKKTLKKYNCDVRDEEGLKKIFSENKIEAVIHFAGLKAVGESVKKPVEYFDNNVNGTITLCKVMKQANVKRIVFSSSATVYGVDGKSPLIETAKTGSVSNPYGRTKYFIEEILKDIYVSDDTWSVSLLRYFNPIGAHKSGNIGEDPVGIPNNLMPYISQVAIGKRAGLTVFGDSYNTPDGTCVRDYIHVVDLAQGHISALEKVLSNTGCNIYNLGTGIGYSVLDVIHTFEKATGCKIPYVIGERRDGDLDTVYSTPEKAEKELGWTAKYSLEDMCADTWNWQKKNPNGFE